MADQPSGSGGRRGVIDATRLPEHQIDIDETGMEVDTDPEPEPDTTFDTTRRGVLDATRPPEHQIDVDETGPEPEPEPEPDIEPVERTQATSAEPVGTSPDPGAPFEIDLSEEHVQQVGGTVDLTTQGSETVAEQFGDEVGVDLSPDHIQTQTVDDEFTVGITEAGEEHIQGHFEQEAIEAFVEDHAAQGFDIDESDVVVENGELYLRDEAVEEIQRQQAAEGIEQQLAPLGVDIGAEDVQEKVVTPGTNRPGEIDPRYGIEREYVLTDEAADEIQAASEARWQELQARVTPGGPDVTARPGRSVPDESPDTQDDDGIFAGFSESARAGVEDSIQLGGGRTDVDVEGVASGIWGAAVEEGHDLREQTTDPRDDLEGFTGDAISVGADIGGEGLRTVTPEGPGPTRQLPFGITLPDPGAVDETGAFGEEGISPGAGMALDDPEAIAARREKEQDILAQTEVDDVSDVPGAIAATGFALGQQIEHEGIETGEAITEAVPSAEVGPQIGEEHVGEVPANLIGGSVSFAGMGAGGALQLPASVGHDLHTQWEGGETPTDIQGGTLSTTGTFLGTQWDMATDYPMSTVAGFAVPGMRGARGFERGLGDAGVTTPPRPTVQRVDVGEVSGVTAGVTRQRGRVTETQPVVTAGRGLEGRTPFDVGTPAASLEAVTGTREFRVPRPDVTTQRPIDVSGADINMRSPFDVEIGTLRQGNVDVTPQRPIDIGMPEVSFQRPVEFGLRRTAGGEEGVVNPEMTAAETGILTDALRRAGREEDAARIDRFRDVQAETQHSQLRPDEAEGVVGDVLESQDIPREAASGLTDLLASEDAQLYGSTVQRASAEQIGEPGVARTPRDIDIGGLESSTEFARQAEQRLNNPFDDPVVTREGATVRSRETGEELFDLHEAGEMSAEGSPSLFGRDTDPFGIREDPTVTTREGVETTTLPEQTRRKGMGATEQIRREPGEVGPIEGHVRPTHEGRVKDIPDFYLGERANIEALRLQGRERGATRAETALEEWVDAFGEDVAQRARTEYDLAQAGERPAPRTELVDFGDGSSPGVFGEAGFDLGSSLGATAGRSPSPSPGMTGGEAASPFGGVFDPMMESPAPSPVPVDSGGALSPGMIEPVDTESPGAAPEDRSPGIDSTLPTDPDRPSPGIFYPDDRGEPSPPPIIYDPGEGPSPPPIIYDPGEGPSPPPTIRDPESPASPFVPPQEPSSPFVAPPEPPSRAVDSRPSRAYGDGDRRDNEEWHPTEPLDPATPLFENPIADVWPPGV